jgi:hypothetical protein
MDLIGQRFVIDIEKARTHKYVKRTGSPGNYKYWYKLPNGELVAEDDKQEMGKLDHIKRLIVARSKGHHEMDNDAIARHVGIDKKKVGSAERNLRRAGRQWQHGTTGAQRQFSAGHDYTDEHLAEAKADLIARIREARGSSATPAAPAPAAAEPARTEAAPAPRRRAPRARAEAPATPSAVATISSLGTDHGFTADTHRKLVHAGLSDEMIKEFGKGIKIDTEGEMQGEMTVPFDRYRDEHRDELLNHVIENARNNKFEVGFKYLQLKGDDDKLDEGLQALGFNKIANAPDSTGRTSERWVHPDGMVFTRTGGYSNLTGKMVKTHRMMKMILEEATYVKDVSPFADGLHGSLKDEQYRSALGSESSSGTTSTTSTSQTEASTPSARQTSSPRAGRGTADSETQRRLQALKDAGFDFGEGSQETEVAPEEASRVQEQAQRAQEAAQAARRQREVEPASPAARELHAVAPDLAEADAPIQAMLEAQRRGENPYLNRAKDIYHNIQADLKPERKDVVRHLLSAIDAVKDSSGKVDQAALLQKYKELSGKNVRGLSGVAEEFEKGTFMTLDEVTGNAPIDVEMERMKRGYAAKQFARMKPFLKQSWVNANPSAPPPMPTFGDVKSWTEHGGSKPSWAGTTRLAMPREVYDAAHKIGGKPKYPPAWMPIHMMPVWNYVMAKTGDDSAYQARGGGLSQGSSPTGWKMNMGSQAGYQEGIVMNAMRKYVQMRGGHDQLTDIPAHKLAEVNLSHSDIFKALDPHDMSDKAMRSLMTTKVVDPVALLPFIKEEMKNKPVKKSIELVVDADLKPFTFKKSFVVDEKMAKAELIAKIRAAKHTGR